MEASKELQVRARCELYGRDDLTRLINPRSVAIVGASPTPGSFGYRTIENTGFGYAGKVYPINPKHEKILGHACYPSVQSLPEVPDCVVLSIPGEQVLTLIEQCAELGVGGAVIYASGFAESGTEAGIAQQQRLSAIARESGMRILGPNCLGFTNFVNRVGITFQPGISTLPMITGPIGLAAQSGGLGSVIVQGMQRGLGFSYSLSSGNSCDVDICDFVNFLIEDDTTKAIACVLEGIRDGARLIEAAQRALVAGKPLIVCKMGNNDLSSQTALSHTGSLTGSVAAYNAMFERTGVIPVDDFEAVLETVAFFAQAKAPLACGVGVMSVSGGAAVMAADKAEQVGLLLPPPAPETSAKLRELMPGFGSSTNPCDITAASLHDKSMYGHSIRAFAEDPSFAAVVVPMMTAHAPATVERAEYLCGLAGTLSKPICIVWLNEWYQGPGSEIYDSSRKLTLFRSMRRCLHTLKAWIDYYDRREKLLAPGAPRITRIGNPAGVQKALCGYKSGATLTERASKDLLAAYGVPVTREKLAKTADEAVSAAAEIGYPVVLKAESDAIPHKTEAGVVHVGLRDAQQVEDAFDAIRSRVADLPERPRINGVLVQEMVACDIELMVGVRRDPQFGPLIVCGLGGIFVELLRDTACALAPVDKRQALAMIKSLKGYRLISGFRGSRSANIDLLVEAICRISGLAADHRASISEMDVNPIVASGDKIIVVDALVIVDHDEQQ